ncbi:hypothetical protein QVD17_38113 [Tagetes erecta]|uniref:Uncharacterized protein n=1 Tax=Tagetes erecta TaxID=13708 RepID=A0AAD8JXC2_TARER|nr:hypothetical protein QVD17_38113 [Tagetes erecta]
MSTAGIENDLKDLYDRLLNALPSSWKHTVTLLKHTEKFPMDVDMLVIKIESAVSSSQRFKEDEDNEYDWRDKSDPIAKIQTEEMNQVEDVNLTVECNKTEEVSLMAQSEQIKVESSSSESEKPSNYVPLLETVKEKLCSPKCAKQFKHY